MKKKTLENIMWVFCIIVISGLSAKLYIDSQEYSCDKCTVTLYNQAPLSDVYFEFGTYQIKELFENYVDGRCLVRWDPTQGYYNG